MEMHENLRTISTNIYNVYPRFFKKILVLYKYFQYIFLLQFIIRKEEYPSRDILSIFSKEI